jgi:hypothetical protein
MLAPETHEAPPHYQLYLEARGVPPRNLAGEFENALRENPHYDYCRRLGQLGPVRLERLRAGAFERFSQRMVQRGQRLGDIKPTPLSPLGDWREWLR